MFQLISQQRRVQTNKGDVGRRERRRRKIRGLTENKFEYYHPFLIQIVAHLAIVLYPKATEKDARKVDHSLHVTLFAKFHNFRCGHLVVRVVVEDGKKGV